MKAAILIGHLKNHGNEGAIIRTAEAFGINNVFVIGKKENVYRTSEGCDRHVNFIEFKDWDEFVGYAKKNNYHLVCIENVTRAKEINEVEKYPSNPIFITGNEKKGVPPDIMNYASLIVKIQQGPGYANCLNTGTACGIILHDFYKKELIKKQRLWDNPKLTARGKD